MNMNRVFRNLPNPFDPKVQQSLGSSIGKILLGGSALIYAASSSFWTVEGGKAGVIFSRVGGVQERVYEEGTHLKLPWFEKPTLFDIRTRPHQTRSLTGTRDLQMVDLTLRVLFRPEPSQLPNILRRFGTDYDQRVLPSIVNETLKAVVAQFNASQLITQRENVSKQIRALLQERALQFNIRVEDVSITHLNFGKEYTAAVEAKQVAQQEAERAKYVVDKAMQDKRSRIIRAQGEAKSAELIGAALAKNPGFVELRRMEAARVVATTIAESSNRVILPSETLLLDLTHTAIDLQQK